MAKYLHKFTSLAEFEAAYNGSDYHEPWVSLTKDELKISLIANYSGYSGGSPIVLRANEV